MKPPLVLIFDTETTALLNNTLANEKHQPHVIEFYGAMHNDATGELVEDLEFLCKPPVRITEEVEKITGLSQDDVKNELPFKNYASRVKDFIGGAQRVVAHNLAYDFNVVNIEAQRASVRIEWPITRICTVRETEWIKGYRLKLEDLHEHLFGAKPTNTHRARSDVETLARCYFKLREQGDL